ncbi:peptide deformylase [Dubosiella muris]|uniref:Peptide deformylase n=1 Tax=Dubosiella muris TaxID=3038133 RepID=A0AC61R4G3_9FIRM|nr:peptide deformylase [Dubosiella muris]TGY64850.1 peptide deformylase [Dubosiella muris]
MKITLDTIISDHDPRIREKSEKVALPLDAQDRELLEAMLTYVRDSQDEEIAERDNLRPAVGIAAIQVGVPKQMLAIVCPNPDNEEEDIELALVNPKIISESVQNAYLDSGEGCLSVLEEHEGHSMRHARIKVRAFDLVRNENVTIRAKGFLAICLQHEIDHLSGILFYDRIDPNDPWKTDPEAEVY